MFKTKYRVSVDSFWSHLYAVQIKRWYFPFWIEYKNGCLPSKEKALHIIELLKKEH